MRSAFVPVGDVHLRSEHEQIVPGFRLLEVAVELREDAQSVRGVRIELRRDAGDDVLASAIVLQAEESAAARRLGGSTNVLAAYAALTEVTFQSAEPTLALALAYAVARRARILDRVSLIASDDSPETKRLLEPVRSRAKAASPQLDERVDVVAHYAARALVEAGAALNPALRAREAEETIKRWLARADEWGFFAAVLNGTLTRSQYVYALSNVYQFVRQTTRLAARAIAFSPTTEMRTHFIKHLNGEVNHELIIERDLNHLGEDVAYVRDSMAPNGPTQEFMSIQESMIGYYQDPVLLMASPMAAEGVSAHLDERFVKGLHGCMRGWGLQQPEKCSKFFISHMHTDGGDDGHWEMTVEFLSVCLVEESKHQFFLRSMKSAMRGTRRLYDSFVDELPAITPPSARREVAPARA